MSGVCAASILILFLITLILLAKVNATTRYQGCELHSRGFMHGYVCRPTPTVEPLPTPGVFR